MKCAAVAVMMVASVSAARADGNAAAGKAKAAACAVCHTGDGNADAPHLAGQRESYLAKQLAGFRSGDRKHELMSPIAAALSEADAADLAAYWSHEPSGADAKDDPAIVAIRKSRLAFPREFPKGYTRYATEGSQKSYVNAVGLAAAKAKRPLPDGTSIVVVTGDAKGKPTAYSMMESRAGWGDAIPAILRNGNWSYGLFTADKAAKPLDVGVCLACHLPAAKTSYVFTAAAIANAK